MKYSFESTIAASLLILIASFILVAKISSHKAPSKFPFKELLPETVLVSISGAVKKPGDYSFPAGTTIEQALRKARPSPDANLDLLPLKKIIDAPLHIFVEELKEIQVAVRGAIAKPIQITLPVRSRISDLKSKVIFTEETEKAFFRRRKLLKNGDEIVVPKKTVE